MRRGSLPVSLLLVFCALATMPAGSAAAAPVEVKVLKRLTAWSPFPGPCGRDSLLVTENAEVEPFIAVRRNRPKRMAIAFMQDSGRSNVVLWSANRGRTWHRVFVPGLSECTGGTEPSALDPWLSFGAGGNLYLGSVVGIAYTHADPGADPVTSIVVARSKDGGRSWRVPAFVQRPIDSPGLFWDKPAVVADPRRPGLVYAVFDQNSQDQTAIGSSFSARSRDGGRSWSRRAEMLNPGTVDAWAASNSPLVLPNGKLVNVGILYGIDAPRVEYFAQRSSDRGSTWSRPVTIGTAPSRQPTSPAGVEVSALPVQSAAVAPNGDAYVVWSDLSSTDASAVKISRSADGGRTWSRPRSAARVSGQAFTPIVAVAGDGTIGVLHYGTQRDRPGDPEWTTDVYLSRSTDRARTWKTRRVAGPFDLNTAERGGGQLFLGDYVGLAGLPHGFAAAFPMAHPKAKAGPSDIFFARIRTRR